MTRTLTETEYAALPSPLDMGRAADMSAVSSLVGPPPRDVFALSALLEAAGYGDERHLTRLRAIHDAVNEATAAAHRDLYATDLATLTPESAAALVREAALSRMLTQGPTNHLAGATHDFEAALHPLALESFRAFAEVAVEQMRPAFDEAAKAVRDAHKSGLTAGMTPASIALDADTKQVAAYRALGPAVGTLDRLAGLRIRVHNALDRASTDHRSRVIACFLAGETTETGRDTAAHIFTGELETVLVTNDHPAAAPAVRKAPRPRLGGPWLSLAAAGYMLRLNTPTEVAVMLDPELTD